MAYKEPKEYTKTYGEYRELPAFAPFTETLEEWGIPADEEKLTKLYGFYRMLYRGNSVMNLTAVIEDNEVLFRHYLDSLSLVKAVPEMACPEAAPQHKHPEESGLILNHPEESRPKEKPAVTRIIDVGTGAGFPGMPLAIFLPGVQFTLMDSLRKRTDFLKECASGLGLENITVIQARAEDLARDAGHREQYDLAVSRAVADLSVLSEYVLPFVRVGGTFVAYKSVKAAEELAGAEAAIGKLGGKAGESISFDLGRDTGERTLLRIEKVRSTPKVYPRKAGEPERKPLK